MILNFTIVKKLKLKLLIIYMYNYITNTGTGTDTATKMTSSNFTGRLSDIKCTIRTDRISPSAALAVMTSLEKQHRGVQTMWST